MKLVLLFLTVLLQSQANTPVFKCFTASEGFPMVAISGLAQDKEGNIWFSNNESGSIFRFDGFDIRQFDGLNPRNIFIAGDGRIYYNEMDRLKVIKNNESKILDIQTGLGTTRFSELEDGALLVCSVIDKVIYHPDTDSTTTVRELEGIGEIRAICKIGNRHLLGSTEGRIYKWAPGQLEELYRVNGNISSMVTAPDGTIWIGAMGKGLWKIPANESAVPVRMLDEDISCMCFRTNNELWLGSDTGLMIYDIVCGEVTHIKSNPIYPNALPHYSIRHILRDKEGGMWLATQYGGICYWNPRQARVKSLKTGTDEYHLNDAVAGPIIEDRKGRIIIGTNNGGINIFDPKSGTISHHLLSKGPGNNDIKAIVELDDGSFLVGCYKSGLNLFNSRDGSFKHLNGPSDIYSIIRENKDNFLCTNQNGVFRYNITEDSIRKISDKYSSFSAKDSKGRFWQGGNISLYVDDTLSFDLPFVKTLYECKDGSILIGSDKGLYAFDNGLTHFENLTIAGLPANLPINSIEQDSKGRFWLGTTNGLYMVASDFKKCMRFSEADGLATNYFYKSSHCLLKSGDLCFGGIGGVSIFAPDVISATSQCPPPVISSIKVHGEEYTPDKKEKIVFKHSQNNLSFTFSVPDYISEGNNLFRYRLDGFETKWYYPSDRRASYSNLPKGKYTLFVECSRNGDIWTPMPVPLEFKVRPVWFLSSVAIILEIIFLLGCIVGIISFSSRQKEIKNRLEMQKLEEKHAKEMSRLKALKFINSGLHGEMGTGKVVTSLKEKDERFIVMAMSIVENNLGKQEFDTDNLAKQMNMSRMSLYKEMKRITGDSALAFIHKIRFTEACRLLKESDKTVSEISYIVGFSSPIYFSERFKKTFGCTPKEYARSKK